MDASSNVGCDGKISSKVKVKPQTRRGRGKGSAKQFSLSILGNNVNGIMGKIASLKAAIEMYDFPAIITLQESKTGEQKCNIPGYKTFPKNRVNEGGGGLITAIAENIPAVQVSDVEEDIIVVEIEVNGEKIRVFNAYGPQEPQNNQDREMSRNFWLVLEKLIVDAKNAGCMIIIQCDANAKLGKNIYPEDPHEQSENGSIVEELVSRNALFILNFNEKCRGTITRSRNTTMRSEASIIDYIIVCEDMMNFFMNMHIDDARKFVLTHYSTRNGRASKTESDHNILHAKFNIKIPKAQATIKREVFNFKDKNCQDKFKEVTDKTTKLSSCFQNPEHSFDTQTESFLKQLDKVFHQCFSKIRITNKTKVTKDDLQLLIKQKCKTLEFLDGAKSDLMIKWFTNYKNMLESKICQLTSEKSAAIIKEQVGHLDTLSGNFCQSGMWKVKRKIYPTLTEPPTAKLDEAGNLITEVEPLKNLYLRTYVHRLRQRQMKDDMLELQSLKTDLWKGRFEHSKSRKSEPWTLKDLDVVLKSLKLNQSRDPKEMLNEIFRPPIIGEDLKLAILYLMNGINENMKLPYFMQMSNITTISKPKSSKFDVNGERGIFILSVFRKIFDKLIYNDHYEHINRSMSDSNIGARKEQNIKNHLFVLYGVINYVLKEEKSSIDICIYDIEKCFDALWLEDVMIDYYDSLPKDKHNDKVAMVYESNRNNYVAIKTSVGLTKRVNIENIVTQGGTFGPIECSNSIDKIGRKSIDENQNLYLYKKLVKIPPLGYIDDILTMSNCGIASLSMNTFINTQIESKRLKFHTPDQNGRSKCHILHIGRKNIGCPRLQVHGEDIIKVEKDTYLGDIISSTGRNQENIKSRLSKGIGIISQIMSILDKITIGKHFFETALILRESMFINSILVNAEIWYGMTSREIQKLCKLDQSLLRKILNTQISTPIESLYLELGCTDIETILKGRRLVYLHYLTQRNTESMLKRFFIAQWKYPTKGDWTEQVKLDLEEFGLPIDLMKIEAYSSYSFKNLIKKKTRELSFSKFMTRKLNHTKLSNLQYCDLSIQKYLTNNQFTVNEARLIFSFRTRMAPFKSNFKSQNEDACPLCNSHQDDQNLAFRCPVILKEIKPTCEIRNIYSNSISIELVQTLTRILEIRNNCL